LQRLWILLLLATLASGNARSQLIDSLSFYLPDKDSERTVHDPVDLAIDIHGLIHVLDRDGRVVVFSASGAYKGEYGADVFHTMASTSSPFGVNRYPALPGSRHTRQPSSLFGPNGPNRHPTRIISSRNGSILVLDSSAKQISVFQPNWQASLSFGREGSLPGELGDPIDIAEGPGGEILVLDADHRSIQVFSADGLFMHEIPLASYGAVTAMAAAPDGGVYVVEDDRPTQFIRLPSSRAGSWTWGQGDSIVHIVPIEAKILQRISRIAVNSKGSVLLVDPDNGWVWQRRTSELVAEGPVHGPFGKGGGPYRAPVGAAFDGSDRIVVLDAKSRRVSVVAMPAEKALKDLPLLDVPFRVCFGSPTDMEGLLVALDLDSTGVERFYFEQDEGKLFTCKALGTPYRTAAGDPAIGFAPDVTTVPAKYPHESSSLGWAAANESILVVTDPLERSITEIDKRTGGVRGTFSRRNRGDLRMKKPSGIALTSGGRTVVADPGSKRLFVLSPDRTSVKEIRMDGRPLMVTNGGGESVLTWPEDGDWLAAYSAEDLAPQKMDLRCFPPRIAGLVRDPFGNWLALNKLTQQISIIDRNCRESLISFGPSGVFEEPGAILADNKGNIYIPDRGRMRTYVYHWSTWAPAPRTFDILYGSAGVLLRWPEADDRLIHGYELHGQDPDGTFRIITRTRKPEYEFHVGDAGTVVPLGVMVAPVGNSGFAGEAGSQVRLPGLVALQAQRDGHLAEAARFAREAIRQLDEEKTARADSSGRSYLDLILFLEAADRSDSDSLVGLAPQVEPTAPAQCRSIVHRVLAQAYLAKSRPVDASNSLLALAADREPAADLSDSTLIALTLRVFEARLAAQDTVAACAFLSRYADHIPEDRPEDRRLYADSIRVTKVRARFGPGLQYWKGGDLLEATRYFGAQLADTTAVIESDQRILGHLILSAAYYAFGRKKAAADEYRKICAVKKDFDFERAADEVERFYRLGLYNPEGRRFFREQGPCK